MLGRTACSKLCPKELNVLLGENRRFDQEDLRLTNHYAITGLRFTTRNISSVPLKVHYTSCQLTIIVLKRREKDGTLITPIIDTLSQRVDNYSKDADVSSASETHLRAFDLKSFPIKTAHLFLVFTVIAISHQLFLNAFTSHYRERLIFTAVCQRPQKTNSTFICITLLSFYFVKPSLSRRYYTFCHIALLTMQLL